MASFPTRMVSPKIWCPEIWCINTKEQCPQKYGVLPQKERCPEKLVSHQRVTVSRKIGVSPTCNSVPSQCTRKTLRKDNISHNNTKHSLTETVVVPGPFSPTLHLPALHFTQNTRDLGIFNSEKIIV